MLYLCLLLLWAHDRGVCMCKVLSCGTIGFSRRTCRILFDGSTILELSDLHVEISGAAMKVVKLISDARYDV